MKTSIDGLSLVCLENTTPWGGYGYSEAYKLNWGHYEKVMLEKVSRGLLKYVNVLPECQFQLNKPFDPDGVQEGDFVHAMGKTPSLYSNDIYHKPLFGWVKKDKDGDLYMESYSLMTSATFIPEKFYLKMKNGRKTKAIAGLTIIFKNKPIEIEK